MKRSYFRGVAAALLAATLALSAVPSQALAQVTYATGTRDVPTWTVNGTAYDSEDAANAAADAKRPEVTSTTAQVDFWKTSDGLEFASEEEAQTHVSSSAEWDDTVTAEMAVFSDGHVAMTAKDIADYEREQVLAGNQVSYSLKNVTNTFHNAKPWAQSIETWMTYVATLDGTTPLQTFDTMEEAQAWCEARQHQVTSSQQAVTTWKTSDGQEFASFEEAQRHCDDALAVAQKSRDVTTWHVFDGSSDRSFATEQEARDFAAQAAPTYSQATKDVVTYETSDGRSFGDESSAKQYCGQNRWDVRDDTFYICPDGTVTKDLNEAIKHGNGYTIRWVFTAYCTAGGSKQFDTREEAEAYAAEKSPTWSMGTKTVTVWRTSDGQDFGDEQAAADYCASKALDVYKTTQSETYYETADGKQFDDYDSASDWAARTAPAMAGTSTSTRTVWGTDADDQTFLTEQEAYKHAASLSPYAIGQRKQRVVWKTSDGRTFDSEEAAKAHGQTLYLTVSKGSRDVVTWRCAGKSFSTKAEAEVYSRSLVPVVVGTRQESGWKTSDGKWFATEAEAAAWAQEQNGKGEWRHDSRGWWFANAAGGYPASGWDEIGGEWYLFDASGYMMTGWQVAGGRWYWLGADGAMKTGWQRVGGSWYWLGALGDGAMATGWAQIDGTWYLLGGSGAMKTGWQKVGGAWYWFDGSGAMTTGWQKVGGSWYLLGASGAMLTGWQQVEGSWYFLGASGAMAHDRWVGNYYVTSSGAMATNQWIDGRWWVGADGKWVG